MRIGVAGSGYVGLVTAACMAELGNDVLAYDIDDAKLKQLKEGICPIFEPGLEELIQQGLAGGHLRFTGDLAELMEHSEFMFIAIGTPPKLDGGVDTGFIEDFAKCASPFVAKPLIAVIKSTVPVGTGAKMEQRLNAQAKARVHVVSNPEFLKEGTAVQDFQRPDRVVIGSDDPNAGERVRELFVPFVRNQKPIMMMSRQAAELTKYACNAYLATRISFINEIANLCDLFGIDVNEVRRGMGADARIGHHFLYPGVGYGGSCLPKDVRALIDFSREAGGTADLLESVHAINEQQKRLLFRRIQNRFAESPNNLEVAIWGLAFKPNTDDIREAPALALIDDLLAAGASVRVYDPEALDNVAAAYQGRVTIAVNEYDAIDGADCLAVCTEWNRFRSPDFERMGKLLKHPVVFDGRNLYEPETMRRYGLEHFSVGRPAVGKKRPLDKKRAIGNRQ